MEKRGWRKHLRNPLLLFMAFSVLYLSQIHLAFWLVWVAFVPCFLLLRRERDAKRRLLWAMASAVVIVFGGMYWFAYYKAYILLLALAAWMAFFCVMQLIAQWLEPRLWMGRLFAYPVSWTMLVVLASFTPLGDFLFNLALMQPDMAPLIWLVKGAGINFLIVLVNVAIGCWILERKRRQLHLLLGLALVILACKGYSALDGTGGEPVKVALLQGNFDQPWEWRVQHADELFETYTAMSLEAVKQRPAIIVWPEYAIPRDIIGTSYRERLIGLSRETGAAIVAGTLRRVNGEGANTDSAVMVTPEGVVRFYDSPSPFPYVENVMPGTMRPEDGVMAIDGTSIGLGLCYEETNTRLVRKLKKAGASIIVSMVNHQIFRDSIGLRIAAQFSRLRAAENRMWVVRSTNTGITQIVDPRGKVTARLPAHERGTLIGIAADHNKVYKAEGFRLFT